MASQTATTLYPVNTTTVDTGTGIDVRFLDTATGSADTTQTVAFTHTNDSVERTFDPATGGVTNTNNAGTTLFKTGWALRLSQDMTPANDTVNDTILPAQTLTVNLVLTATQSGGTYVSGVFTPTVRASLWRYNPATDTGTLIAAGTNAATSWNAASEMGQSRNVAIPITLPATVFGAAKGTTAEILMLQVGLNTGTVPNPTIGTANWVVTLTVGTASTNVTLTDSLAQVGYGTGTATGSGTATAAGAPVLTTTGTATGLGTATGVLGATKMATGSATGSGTATGAFGAVKLGTGSAAGVGTAAGAGAKVAATVGTVNIGSGGSSVVRKLIPIPIEE